MKKLLTVGLIVILTASCQKTGKLPALVQSHNSTEENRAINAAKSTSGSGTGSSFIGTITDVDGNIYHAIKIGTQTWMVENLKTTKYADGTPIPNVTDLIAWNRLTTGAYVNYNNDAQYVPVYGRLYNLFAATNTKHLLAPAGWHIPTKAEWTTLINFLGGEAVAGGKLKENGFSHWQSPNPTTVSTGFLALPAGRHPYGGLGQYGDWWSSDPVPSARNMNYTSINSFTGFHSPTEGLSVRCIRNAVKESF